MTVDFQTYDKIPGSSKRWGSNPADERRLARMAWVVTEKIHGANFCFILHAGTIDCAKRKAVLSDDEDFFSHRTVLERLRAPLRQLFVDHRGSATRLLVYGELFGGGYPHPDVPPVPGVQPIQTGVWYSPGIDFRAFDVAAEDGQGRRRWWGHDAASDALNAAQVPTLPPLFIGTYNDARAQPVSFQTTLPAQLGLPPLADNLAEGIVLKPRDPVLINGQRPTLKLKPARFSEDARYHQSEKWSATPPATDPLDTLEFAMMSRLTPTRFASARSKLGPQASHHALAAEIFGDVMVDVLEEHTALLRRLAPDDHRLLEETLQQEAEALVSAQHPDPS